jgi:hypothetical protein
MRKSGVKMCDDIRQIDWLIVSAEQCPDETAQQQLVARHFRIPHDPYGNDLTFVQPVHVHRSRRRILFRQESGEVLG